MRNVIIFVVAGERFAVELRWVNEVVTLAPVTPVPGAPVVVIGVINYRGAIVPVLDVSQLHNTCAPADWTTIANKMAVILDIEQVKTCLVAQRIDEVSTLEGERDAWKDSRGQSITLLEPPALLHVAERHIDESTGVS